MSDFMLITNVLALTRLKSSIQQSSLQVIRHKDKNIEISEENPIIIDIKIAPKTCGILLLEKYDGNSGIEIDSI